MRELPHAVELEIRVLARASRASVGGFRDGCLVVRVREPAVDGRANEALRSALARALGVRPAAVELVQGLRSRRKRLQIAGDPGALRSRLQALAGRPEPLV